MTSKLENKISLHMDTELEARHMTSHANWLSLEHKLNWLVLVDNDAHNSAHPQSYNETKEQNSDDEEPKKEMKTMNMKVWMSIMTWEMAGMKGSKAQ